MVIIIYAVVFFRNSFAATKRLANCLYGREHCLRPPLGQLVAIDVADTRNCIGAVVQHRLSAPSPGGGNLDDQTGV